MKGVNFEDDTGRRGILMAPNSPNEMNVTIDVGDL